MAWTAPMTATANAPFLSSEFNTHVRDNLLETEAAKATSANGSFFQVTGTNTLTTRQTAGQFVEAAQSTTSTTYVTLPGGPSVSVVTGTAAIVWITARMYHEFTNNQANYSVAVSGATTIAADDSRGIWMDGLQGVNSVRYSACTRFTNLTAGTNTFTLQAKVPGGSTGFYADREIVVLPV